MGSLLLIFAYVRRRTSSVTWAYLSACLFAATYAIGGAWFDLARVDPLFLFFLLAGVHLSNTSNLGAVGAEILTDNDTAWSGDHGMDPPDVPGILAASRPLKRPAANLRELRSSVLAVIHRISLTTRHHHQRHLCLPNRITLTN